MLSGWRCFLAGSCPCPACFGLADRDVLRCLPEPWVQDVAGVEAESESGLGTDMCYGGPRVAAEQGDILP